MAPPIAGTGMSDGTQTARLVPRGWRDLALQAALWSGFLVCFDAVSSLAGRRPEEAIANGLDVVNGERALWHGLPEVIVQRAVDSSHALTTATVLTYRTSEFVVLSLALVWVYLRRNDAFARFRNTILVTNVAALAVYFALPTAPPRMFPEFGFVDTIARAGGPSRDQGPLAWAANPYAAMPSLHSADALIVGVGLALLVRRPALKVLWLLWPVWVWFSVVATGNHFVMDVVAGVGLAVASAAALHGPALARRYRRSALDAGSAGPASSHSVPPR